MAVSAVGFNDLDDAVQTVELVAQRCMSDEWAEVQQFSLVLFRQVDHYRVEMFAFGLGTAESIAVYKLPEGVHHLTWLNTLRSLSVSALLMGGWVVVSTHEEGGNLLRVQFKRKTRASTAINFADLLNLKQSVQQVLTALHSLPQKAKQIRVTFYKSPQRPFVVVSSEDLSKQSVSLSVPQGLSDDEWSKMVSLELENHLISGGKFSTCWWLETPDTGFEVLALQRG